MSLFSDQYRSLAESISDAFFAMDKELKFTFWNKTAEKLTGITSHNALGKSIYELFPDVKNTPAEKAYLQVLGSGKVERIFTLYNFNGKPQPFEITVNPLSDGISVIAKELTDIIKNNNNTEERYKNTLDNMLEGCAIIDYDWNYLYANEVHKKHARISLTDVAGRSLFELVPGFKESNLFKVFSVAMEKRIPKQLEDSFTFNNSETRWFESRALPVPEGIFILTIEITDRKKNEENLVMYKSVLDQSEKMAHLGSWWMDIDQTDSINKNKLNWSDEVFRIFGYEPGAVEVSNDLFFSHVHPEDRDNIKESITAAIAEKQPYDIEHRIITADGTEKIVHEYATAVYDEKDNPVGIFGAVHDITKMRTAIFERDTLLKQIEQEKNKLKTIIDSVPVEIWVFDEKGSLMFVNPAVKINLGFDNLENLTLESVLADLDIRHLNGKKRSPDESALYKSLKGEVVSGDEMVRHLKTGEKRFRHFHSAPIKNSTGYIFGVVVVVSDITEQKRAEEKILDLLRVSELRGAELHATIESMPDAVYIGSREGITLCNTNALKMLGAKSLADLKERIGELAVKFNVRWPDTGIPLKENELQFTKALNGETVVEEVMATNAETGEDIFIRSACAPIIQNNNIIGAVAVNSDITERKKAENIIKNSLLEKEVLLRELYHRTKNNMQVISSLIGLKASSVEDPETSNILEDMKNRILSIALVHQKLYQSKNLSRVNLKEYISDLINLLESSYSSINPYIQIKMELEKINVLIDTAVPVGLIINELVSNSYKHAFPGNRQGIINICLRKLNQNLIELVIADNGKGSSEEELKTRQKLGLQLVQITAMDQLQAEVNLDTSEGIKWEIRFKDILYKERV